MVLGLAPESGSLDVQAGGSGLAAKEVSLTIRVKGRGVARAMWRRRGAGDGDVVGVRIGKSAMEPAWPAVMGTKSRCRRANADNREGRLR